MAEFPYTNVPGKIKNLLLKIRQVGIPPKASVAWLKTIGFKSSNDASLLGVLKYVDLIDANGVPTPRWNQYRGASHKEVLGQAIREGYKELYAIYSDAHSRDKTDITHVFSTSSTAGQQVINRTVATFKALCDESIFPEPSGEENTLSSGPLHTAVAEPNPMPASVKKAVGPSVHIDIQVHISPESTSDQIESIFKSMAKHLYGAKVE